MLDVSELEKKWANYHFKKMLPRYIISGVILVATTVGTYIFLVPPKPLSTKAVQVPITPQATVTSTLVKRDVVQSTKTVSEDSMFTAQNILVPSYAFTLDLDKALITYNNSLLLAAVTRKEKSKSKPIYKPKKKKIKKHVKTTTAKKPVKRAKAPVKKKPKKVVSKKTAPTKSIILGQKSTSKTKVEPDHAILQKKKTTSSELASVIKRFNKSKKPALGLFIANKYYVSGNYKASYKYARATYKINPNIEDAVLLYAKSLAKLGHKDKAIAKLKPYIKKSGSIEAKALLNDLNKGLFK